MLPRPTYISFVLILSSLSRRSGVEVMQPIVVRAVKMDLVRAHHRLHLHLHPRHRLRALATAPLMEKIRVSVHMWEIGKPAQPSINMTHTPT